MASTPQPAEKKAASALVLKRWTIDAGGGQIASATRRMTATIGQPDAGTASSPTGWELQAGFWFARSAGGDIFADSFEAVSP
jgi:hypothetical protein